MNPSTARKAVQQIAVRVAEVATSPNWRKLMFDALLILHRVFFLKVSTLDLGLQNRPNSTVSGTLRVVVRVERSISPSADISLLTKPVLR